MKADLTKPTPNSSQPERPKGYHAPALREYGSARDLTRMLPGTGADGDVNDGIADNGLDANNTAS
jgi:hypothetical protein